MARTGQADRAEFSANIFQKGLYDPFGVQVVARAYKRRIPTLISEGVGRSLCRRACSVDALPDWRGGALTYIWCSNLT